MLELGESIKWYAAGTQCNACYRAEYSARRSWQSRREAEHHAAVCSSSSQEEKKTD